jgi:hypothetical protein
MVLRATSAIAVALVIAACGGRTVVTVPRGPISPEQMAELWIDPGPEPRDLFWGVGGQKYAPSPDAIYKVKGKDDLGFSVSFDVEDPDDLGWSAKVGPEAQTEVVMSRILWGLGYHQPPLYYLPSWNADEKGSKPRRESEARFRPKLPELKRLEEYWFWADNPFSGTRQLKGLLAMMLMLNSTDLKDDNNSIYEPKEEWDGAKRWFLNRDIGAALGDTGKLFPRRNWLEGFERNPFIISISEDKVEIHYKGRHQDLLSMITPADVQWGSQQMARLTDAQWHDAFRAGNYADPIADRYIARIKEKIADGLALRVDRRVRAGTY